MFDIDYPTAAYAAALKTLCDDYKLSQHDLYMGRFSPSLKNSTKTDHVQHVKFIPVKLNLPKELLPDKDRVCGGLLIQSQVAFHDSNPYDRYDPGLREFRLYNPDQSNLPRSKRDSVRFWHWNGEIDDHPLSFSVFVEKKNLFRLRKYARKIDRNSTTIVVPPILPRGMLTEIYKNTIGFLASGKSEKELYKEYDIPYKRGILLSGKPGCGKTMTCKWLRNLAINHDFYYRVVTLEEYEHARQHGSVRALFGAPRNRPGIIFFDDLDVMVKDRKTGNLEIMPFLTNMDGIYPAEGVVFVFTTNVMEELDEAFVRPGRIDLWLPFAPPGKKLRQQFVEERFHKNILAGVDVDDIVERTNDYTFAEIEEIRKLFALDIISGKEVSTEKTFKTFDRHRDEFQERVKLGFNQMEDEEEEWDEDDDELWEALRQSSRMKNIALPPGFPISYGPPMVANDQSEF